MDALNASHDDTLILIFKWCTTFSASYLALDALLRCFQHTRSLPEKAAFVVHHLLCFVSACPVFLTNPIITYISALMCLIEWSTVALNVRIFAKLWRLERMYFFAGWAIIILYPFTRIAWNAYLVWISFASEYLTHYITQSAKYFLGGCQLFVFVLSAYYYAAVIMAKPTKMYNLNWKQE